MATQNIARKIEINDEEGSHNWIDISLEFMGLKDKVVAKDELVQVNDEFETTKQSKDKEPEVLKLGNSSKETIDSHLVMRKGMTERHVLRTAVESGEDDDDLFDVIVENSGLKEKAEKMGINTNKKGWKIKLAERLEVAKKSVASVSEYKKMDKRRVREIFREMILEFGNGKSGKDFKAMELNIKTLRTIAKKSWDKTKGEFFLFRPFMFIKEMVLYGLKWRAVHKFEKEIGAYQEVKAKGNELASKTKEEREKIKKGYCNYRRAKNALAINPAAMEGLKMLKRSYSDRMHGVVSMLLRKKIKGNEALDQMQGIAQDVTESGMQIGKNEFARAVSNKEFAGFQLKKVGKFLAIEVMTRGLLEAIEERRFDAFSETITDSSTLLEMVPGVGSWNSLKRLGIDNGEPMWAKGLDVTLNFLGDGYMFFTLGGAAAATFLTGGAAAPVAGTAVAGAAAMRVGIVAAGRKGIQKLVTRFGTKEAIRNAMTKESIKHGVKNPGKLVGKSWRGIKNNLGTAAMTTGVVLDYYIPDGKIAEITTKVLISKLDLGTKALLEVADIPLPKN